MIPTPGVTPATAAPAGDLFTAAGITLEAPSCDGTATPAQTEGPYYKPNTPERNSLLEAGTHGKRMLVVGYVLDAKCQPVPNAWLDFWQADANGEYDNAGYNFRGHQFADAQGRYFLETVYPGEYPGRTQHIHVKVRATDSSEILTSQLYFPDAAGNSSDGIFTPETLVKLEDHGNYLVAYYNFVLP
jgi:protocatechuate 3,4-dioxygenase beta subunit